MAAAYDPRIRVVVPIVTWNSLVRSFLPNDTAPSAPQPGVFKQAWASVFLGGLSGLSSGSLRGGTPLATSPCPAFVDAVCAAYVATAEAGQAAPEALALMSEPVCFVLYARELFGAISVSTIGSPGGGAEDANGSHYSERICAGSLQRVLQHSGRDARVLHEPVAPGRRSSGTTRRPSATSPGSPRQTGLPGPFSCRRTGSSPTRPGRPGPASFPS